ncbi:MAG: phosphate ABC transporter substrate-binding protein, partial [Cyclobacteriaceae bacterium]|nr:phosphate ABC transporter substrate-binding protein [Cyclobacteriaceae bacterium]
MFLLILSVSSCNPDKDKIESKEPPNLLWIVSEDNSPFFGCYGDEFATTPTFDKLA